jgi:hypothetical protein
MPGKKKKEKEKETNKRKRNIQKQATEVWVGGETFNMMPSAAPQR